MLLIRPVHALQRGHTSNRVRPRSGALIVCDANAQRGRCRHRRRDRDDICFTPDNTIDEERIRLERERPRRRGIHEVSGDIEEKEKCEQVTWTPARQHSAHESNSSLDYHQGPTAALDGTRSGALELADVIDSHSSST